MPLVGFPTAGETRGETMSRKKRSVDDELEQLQPEAFTYFLQETNPADGRVIDKTTGLRRKGRVSGLRRQSTISPSEPARRWA
jgi:hypothetical protein